MAKYRVTIEVVVEAESEEHAVRLCKHTGEEHLSKDICDIKLDDKEADAAMQSFNDAL